MTKKFFLALLMSCFALFASSSNYLTFTAEEDNSSFRIKNVDGNNPNIEYSLDDGETWTVLEANEEGTSEYVILGKKGDKALLRGYNPDGFSISKFESHKLSILYTCFNMQGEIAASGSVMSLIDGIGESKTIPSDYCFYALFYNCESLTQAPELPATTLADNCYEYMFLECTSLTQAPELPATTLADLCYHEMYGDCKSLIQAPELPAMDLAYACYYGMFEYCESLTQAPALPATTLTKDCYEKMFEGCKNLCQAPALPASTLADNCYEEMFLYCKSLTQAPELPATTLARSCYNSMFHGCTNLVQAPALPATVLADFCYTWMFCECTSLTQAPALPATTLAYNCYSEMFYGCTSLTQAPALPATDLAEDCYEDMFKGCTSLIQAPELPATDLARSCYNGMFSGCTSLTQTPELPAMELADYCYELMFQNCRNLQKIKVGFDIWHGETDSWVENVAPTGTFYCPKELPIEYGASRIPEGWNVEYIDEGTDVAEHVSDASFKAWAADGKITYTGATMPVEIYGLNGRLVKKMNEKSQSVDVPQHGIYVVKSGNVSLKVEL